MRSILAVTQRFIIMETTNKEIIEKKVYESGTRHDDYVERKARNGFGMGLAGVLTGGAALLSQWGGGRGLFGFGRNNSLPENININTVGGAGAYGAAAPTAFQAWEKSCDDAIALTNTIWGLKVGSMQADYDHRNTDVAEKFSIYKSQVDGDFALYKSIRDLYDNTNDKMNAAHFGLYKEQRDGFDVLNARISQLEKEVAVGAAIRPYQDKLIQCDIEKAYIASINHADRLDCRNIKGVVTLPSTPTVTGFPSQRCGCFAPQETAPAAA